MYVRAPPEGLPPVQGMTEVAPHELLRVVKGAYGLAEAPGLWYLRALELLEKAGMKELSFARSTFIYLATDGTPIAACCVHVDDGLLIGQGDHPEFQELLGRISQSFNIKERQKVGVKPTKYLGMEMTLINNVFTDDMTSYVNNIQPAEIKVTGDGPLNPQQTTAFGRLVMQRRWPAQHVLPEFMFIVSELAQVATRATGSDWNKACKVLKEMQDSAARGKAKITYHPLDDQPMVVTYFDAVLGKKNELRAQQGEFHFVTTKKALIEKTFANVIEYHYVSLKQDQ